jgi:hypothetical protein
MVMIAVDGDAARRAAERSGCWPPRLLEAAAALMAPVGHKV